MQKNDFQVWISTKTIRSSWLSWYSRARTCVIQMLLYWRCLTGQEALHAVQKLLTSTLRAVALLSQAKSVMHVDGSLFGGFGLEQSSLWQSSSGASSGYEMRYLYVVNSPVSPDRDRASISRLGSFGTANEMEAVIHLFLLHSLSGFRSEPNPGTVHFSANNCTSSRLAHARLI